jgi:hypothetical protein
MLGGKMRMEFVLNATRLVVAGSLLSAPFFAPEIARAQKGLSAAERREMREEGYTPAEINRYNQEVIRGQQPYSLGERAELRAQGYTPAEINRMQKDDIASAREEREMDILDSQYRQGIMSEAQYERRAEQIERKAYTQAYGAIIGAAMYKQDQEEGGQSWYNGGSSQSTIDQTQFYSGVQQEITQTGPQRQEQLARLAELKSTGSAGATTCSTAISRSNSKKVFVPKETPSFPKSRSGSMKPASDASPNAFP